MSNTTNTTNTTTTTTTTAAVEVTTPITEFTTTLAVELASHFDSDAYIKSIVETSGVPAGNVEIEVSYTVKVSYQFAEAVTEAEVTTAAAHMAGVAESDITVTLTPVRRLQQSAQLRRLATVADVEIKTADATKADTVKAAAADETQIMSSMETAANKVVTATVSTPPAMEVKVVTKIVSLTSEAVEAPSASAIGDAMTAKTGHDFVVTVGDATVVQPTITSTPVSESSYARRKEAASCFVGILAVLLAQAVIS